MTSLLGELLRTARFLSPEKCGIKHGGNQYQGSITEANGWKHTFSDLPRAVKAGSDTKKLTYRVVETQVTYTLPGEEDATEVDGERLTAIINYTVA